MKLTTTLLIAFGCSTEASLRHHEQAETIPFCNSTEAGVHHSDFGQEGRCLHLEARWQHHHAQTTSPFAPPEEDDLTFVGDSGPGLDTGCTFRGKGPLVLSVKIPRVFGDIDKLLAAGLISETATLFMPAYDVDFVDGERDVVSLNGTPLPGFLTGVDSIWKLNTFNVPLSILNFPTDPGESGTAQEEDNVISIDIDINSEGWCVAIDWAVIAIQKAPLPVVLLRGILSSGNVWEPVWETELEKLGIPHDGNQNLGELESIQSNANLIASRVSSSLDRWGVKKVNIVCHSIGGLDLRHYVESADNVANVIQIGTPNGGSPLFDFIQWASLKSLINVPTILINLFGGPAGVRLTTAHMTIYNLMHGSNGNVRYTALAGMYDAGCFALNPFCRPLDRLLLSISGSPGDTIVPQWSVHALGYTGKPSYSSSGVDGSAKHSSLIQSHAVFNQLQGRVTANRRALQTSSAPEPEYQFTNSMCGIMIPGDTFLNIMYIDETNEAYIMLLYPSGILGFTLISPAGTTIDPAFAASNPSIVGYEDSEVFGRKVALYALINPVVGFWKIQISGKQVLEPQIPFAVSGLLLQPAIKLKASLVSPSVPSGAPLVFVAELTDSNGPTRASFALVTVESPDGTLTTFNLRDDGVTPDDVANDGLYTGSLIETSQAGNYRAAVAVQARTAPIREVFVLGSVSAATATVNNFSENPLDTDFDGLFNQLEIFFDVSVTVPGDFFLLAILIDSEGNEQNVGMTVSVVDTSTLSVSFDGETIYNNGVDGPYTLSVLRLAEESDFSVAVVVNLEDAYTTVPYHFNQFDHSALQVKGGTTIPLDFNSNGLFDRLDVSLDVETISSGFYKWSASLRDSLGTEIDLDSGSAIFSSGSNSFVLMFDGTLIGDNRVDGPYFVSDLLLFGAGESLVQSTAVYTTYALLARQFESTLPPPTVSPSASPTVDPCNDPVNFCGKFNAKVEICYKGKKSMCIRRDELEDYLNERSSCGVCPSSSTSAKSQKKELFSR